MDVRLRVTSGTHSGKEIPLSSPKFLIGRAEDCHLRANSEMVSRHHCVVTVGPTDIRVRDLGSRNGTIVNGAKIEGDHILSAGDQLIVGPLQFEIVSKQGLAAKKQPSAPTIADAAARSGAAAKPRLADDDITSWLIDPAHPIAKTVAPDSQTVSNLSPVADTQSVKVVPPASVAEKAAKADDSSAGKSGPGKLPKSEPVKTKDSREAAANILKQINKRR